MLAGKMTPMHVMDRIEGKTIWPMDIMILPEVADEGFSAYVVLTQWASIYLCWLRAGSIRMRSEHQFHCDLGRARVGSRWDRCGLVKWTIHLSMLRMLLMMSDQSCLGQEGGITSKTFEQWGCSSNLTSPFGVGINLHRTRPCVGMRRQGGRITWSLGLVCISCT